MKQPFFSIIVVSFNAENLIEKTIQSVLQQEFEDFEIIVKDACSVDQTVNRIPKDARINTYVTKDSGIYFGMNEAIGYANGKYLLFLNCGDCLADEKVLSTINITAQALDERNTIIYGDYCRNGIKVKQPSNLTDFYLYRTPLCHQTVFFGSGVLKKFGGYDTKYKILADYDFTLKSYYGTVQCVYCPYVICNYLGGGVSESASGIQIKEQERIEICDHYFSSRQQRIFNFKLALSLKGFRQKLVDDRTPKWIRQLYHSVVNRINK